MARPSQLHRNETFCKLKKYKYLNAYHQRFDLKIVIFTARKRSILHKCICVQVLILSSLSSCYFEGSSPGRMPRLVSDQTSKLFVLLWRGNYHCMLKMCE